MSLEAQHTKPPANSRKQSQTDTLKLVTARKKKKKKIHTFAMPTQPKGTIYLCKVQTIFYSIFSHAYLPATVKRYTSSQGH